MSLEFKVKECKTEESNPMVEVSFQLPYQEWAWLERSSEWKTLEGFDPQEGIFNERIFKEWITDRETQEKVNYMEIFPHTASMGYVLSLNQKITNRIYKVNKSTELRFDEQHEKAMDKIKKITTLVGASIVIGVLALILSIITFSLILCLL